MAEQNLYKKCCGANKMLQILLIGVIHQYQWDWDKNFGWALQADQLALYRGQRELYREWIRALVRNFGPDLIFDEFNSVYGDPDDRLEDIGVSWVYMWMFQNLYEESLACRRTRVHLVLNG